MSLNLAKMYSYHSKGGKGPFLHEYSLELQNQNFGGKRLAGVSQKLCDNFFNAVVQQIYPSYCKKDLKKFGQKCDKKLLRGADLMFFLFFS